MSLNYVPTSAKISNDQNIMKIEIPPLLESMNLGLPVNKQYKSSSISYDTETRNIVPKVKTETETKYEYKYFMKMYGLDKGILKEINH